MRSEITRGVSQLREIGKYVYEYIWNRKERLGLKGKGKRTMKGKQATARFTLTNSMSFLICTSCTKNEEGIAFMSVTIGCRRIRQAARFLRKSRKDRYDSSGH